MEMIYKCEIVKNHGIVNHTSYNCPKDDAEIIIFRLKNHQKLQFVPAHDKNTIVIYSFIPGQFIVGEDYRISINKLT